MFVGSGQLLLYHHQCMQNVFLDMIRALEHCTNNNTQKMFPAILRAFEFFKLRVVDNSDSGANCVLKWNGQHVDSLISANLSTFLVFLDNF